MPVRLSLVLLAGATLLAACQPPPATTVTAVGPDGTASTVTSTTPADVTVVPDATAGGAAVGVSSGGVTTVTSEPL